MSRSARLIEDLLREHPAGFDLSLNRIRALLDRLGNPHHALPPVIHVAGTNGKGSTIAFCRSILEAAGLAVHVHTSPHLVDWHERFLIGQKDAPAVPVAEDTLADAIQRVTDANSGQPTTLFEALTATMFLLFAEQPADVALVEVGLGGELDATNVIETPAVCVITPIALDHMAFLGTTIAEIAAAKAGIIKSGRPVLSAAQQDDAADIIRRQAARKAARLLVQSEDFTAHLENGRLCFQDDERFLDLDLPSLVGTHQIENAGLAIAACLEFFDQMGKGLSADAISKGLRSARWPGRLQLLERGRLHHMLPEGSEIWLDGGHNDHAGQAVAAFVNQIQGRDPRPLAIIVGMLASRDPKTYLQHVAPLADMGAAVPLLSTGEGHDPAALIDTAREYDLELRPASSIKEALAQFFSEDAAVRVMFCGSLYLVGDAIAANGTPVRM